MTYDSSDHAFVIHRESYGKSNMIFRMHQSGLHVWDPYGTTDNKGVTLVNTVSKNMVNFMKRQVKGAEAARKLYAKLAYPSAKDFKIIVKHNMIANCPVTVNDIEVAHKIWGKSLVECLEQRHRFLVGQMIHRSEMNLAQMGEEEWDLVHKE